MFRFFDWSIRLRPTWVSFIVFTSGLLFFSMLALVILSSIYLAVGPVGFLIPLAIVVVYAWYVALFKQ